MTNETDLLSPWSLAEEGERMVVKDAAGRAVSIIYFAEEKTRAWTMHRLARAEARKIAEAIARIPDRGLI
jgi:hypothetical protein